MSLFRNQKVGVFGLLGGAVLAVGALLGGHRDLGLGVLFGTLAALVNFWGLERLTEKTLSGDLRKGLAFFWFFNLARWTFFILACWVFWRFSADCFFGACLGYFWCLAVLLTAAWRRRNPPKIS